VVALEDGDVRDAELGELERGAEAEGAAADDGHRRPGHLARSTRRRISSIVLPSIGVEMDARPLRAIRTPARYSRHQSSSGSSATIRSSEPRPLTRKPRPAR